MRYTLSAGRESTRVESRRNIHHGKVAGGLRAVSSAVAVALVLVGVRASGPAFADPFGNQQGPGPFGNQQGPGPFGNQQGPGPSGTQLSPGNLLVSRSVYDNNPNNLTAGVTVLPPNCVSGCAVAIAGGTYPQVFNNDNVDGSFGITSKIFLDQLTPFGQLINSIEVPNSSDRGVGPNSDQMVTSFSSKSELALNLSTDNRSVTFMGYLAPMHSTSRMRTHPASSIRPTRSLSKTIGSLRRSTNPDISVLPRRMRTAATTVGPRS
jgi:hypothetical protein